MVYGLGIASLGELFGFGWASCLLTEEDKRIGKSSLTRRKWWCLKYVDFLGVVDWGKLGDWVRRDGALAERSLCRCLGMG